MEIKDFIELLNVILWPLITLVIFLYIRSPIISLLKKSKDVKIKVPGGTEIFLSLDRVESIVQDVVEGIDELVKSLSDNERFILMELSKHGPSEIQKLFPKFERSTSDQPSEQHEALRALRKKNIVKPIVGGRFRTDKIVEITPFGKLVLQLKKNLKST